MNNRFAKYKYDPQIVNSISISIKCIFLFFIGIGRYRICIFISLYFLLKSLIARRYENIEYIKVLYLIVGLPLLYADIVYGQIFPIYRNNILLFILSFGLLELFSKKYTNLFVEKFTNLKLFSFCRSCGYENVELVARCKRCFSENIEDNNCDEITILGIYNNYNKINSNYHVLKAMLSKRIVNIVKFTPDEKIIFNIKVPFSRGIHKNGNKRLCKNIIITNKNVIFIDYKFYHRGWTYLEKLPIESLKNIEVSTKDLGIAEFPILKITTKNDEKYEFFVSIRNLQKNEYENIKNEICNFIDFSKISNLV